jgi:hypothetical protein
MKDYVEYSAISNALTIFCENDPQAGAHSVRIHTFLSENGHL